MQLQPQHRQGGSSHTACQNATALLHSRHMTQPPAHDNHFLPRLAALVIFAAVVYLLGNGAVALWDRDEPRYAQTARQMLQSGDWVVPRLYDEPRTAKPVFIYWCQASAMAIFGDTAFAARLPSVVAMTLLLIVLAIAVAQHIDPEH